METKQGKIKVLFVITKSNWGGAQKYVYDLATNLSKETFEVTVALGGHGLLKDSLHNARIRTITVPFLTRDADFIGDIRSFFELVRLFHAEKPQVIHLNSSKVGILGGLAARVTRIPHIIFTAHGWAFNENRSILSRVTIKTLSWFTVLLSHKTIAVSRAIAQDMRWLRAPSKMQIISNGILSPEMLERDQAREQFRTISQNIIPYDAFMFGTIAELHPNKGILYAIEGFAKIATQHPNAFYIIIGGGQEEASLQSLIAEKKLLNRVILLGFLEHAASYLKAFDCFILPSTTEALGYVLLEAGSAELPVIASNIGGIPEIIQDMKTGLLVEARNVNDIEHAMRTVLTSPTHEKYLGAALKEKIIHEYNVTTMIEKTINLYLQK